MYIIVYLYSRIISNGIQLCCIYMAKHDVMQMIEIMRRGSKHKGRMSQCTSIHMMVWHMCICNLSLGHI